MLKANKILSAVLICSSVIAVSTMTGCRTASIPVEVTVPGEFNLSGISKIAIVDFNSVPGDPVAGVYAADKDTMSIVQRMIATTFCKGKMYQIANLDIEKEIADKHTAKLANKFDAVMYGRVWWQVSPEYRNTYPENNPSDTISLIALADLYKKAENFSEATKFYYLAIKRFEKDIFFDEAEKIRVIYNVAHLFEKTNKNNMALKYYHYLLRHKCSSEQKKDAVAAISRLRLKTLD